jgi:hypothetical protein
MIRTSARQPNASVVLLAVCLASVSVSAWAKNVGTSPRTDYYAALEKLRAGERGELEPVYRLGLDAAAWLEVNLSEQDEARAAGKAVEQLDTKLEGFVVSTEEVLFAVPDPGFFLKLAKEKGTPADVAFFENRLRTYASSPAWPVYRQQQTDATGCDLFQTPKLIAVYRGWTQYAAKYPNAYVDLVKEEIAAIDLMMTTQDCACGTKKQVLAGFAAFIRAFPKAAITPQVKDRLKVLKSKTPGMRYGCKSG